jgi:hypothetical protein
MNDANDVKIGDAMKGEVWARSGFIDLFNSPRAGNALVSMSPAEARHFARMLVLGAEKAEELLDNSAEAAMKKKGIRK